MSSTMILINSGTTTSQGTLLVHTLMRGKTRYWLETYKTGGHSLTQRHHKRNGCTAGRIVWNQKLIDEAVAAVVAGEAQGVTT